MKKYSNLFLYGVIGVLAFLLWIKSCTGEEKKQTVTIPEQTGNFKPVINPKPDTIKEPYPVVKWKDKIVYQDNPVNQELVNELRKALEENDSLKALAMYADAVAIREYTIPLEDSLVKTENYFKTQGELLEFKQSYILKERKVDIKTPELLFRLLGKIEVGNTTQFDNFNAKANLMFQNKKGNIYSIGFDTEERIYVGYGFKIFEIKK